MEHMTIGAYANATGLSVSAVRFYCDRGLLEPADVDEASGYRFFTQAQVGDGRLVRDLRLMEMPLSQIRAALEGSPSERAELVRSHIGELHASLRRARSIARTIEGSASLRESTTEDSTMTDNSTHWPDDSSTTRLGADDLAQALRQVLPAASRDPERPDLMGVLVEVATGSLRIAATDSHRLALRDLVVQHEGEPFRVVVPAATLEVWIEQLSVEGEVELGIDTRQLRAALVTGAAPAEPLTASVLRTPFPDYEALLVPADDVTTLSVDREAFVHHLNRADSVELVMTTDSKHLRIQDGDDLTALAAIGRGAEHRFGISRPYALDAVRHTIGREVTIEIQSPLAPIVFRSADDGTYTMRVMPIALD